MIVFVTAGNCLIGTCHHLSLLEICDCIFVAEKNDDNTWFIRKNCRLRPIRVSERELNYILGVDVADLRWPSKILLQPVDWSKEGF